MHTSSQACTPAAPGWAMCCASKGALNISRPCVVHTRVPRHAHWPRQAGRQADLSTGRPQHRLRVTIRPPAAGGCPARPLRRLPSKPSQEAPLTCKLGLVAPPANAHRAAADHLTRHVRHGALRAAPLYKVHKAAALAGRHLAVGHLPEPEGPCSRWCEGPGWGGQGRAAALLSACMY